MRKHFGSLAVLFGLKFAAALTAGPGQPGANDAPNEGGGAAPPGAPHGAPPRPNAAFGSHAEMANYYARGTDPSQLRRDSRSIDAGSSEEAIGVRGNHLTNNRRLAGPISVRSLMSSTGDIQFTRAYNRCHVVFQLVMKQKSPFRLNSRDANSKRLNSIKIC
eukprot:Selendium_serpulae@DN1638_c0_g1_i1.p1